MLSSHLPTPHPTTLPLVGCLFSLAIISLFVGLGIYFKKKFILFYFIPLALAENQLGQSDGAQCWLMAWSPSKLPDVLALTCGWSSTSVMPPLYDSRGCPLLAGSAVHTWLAGLVVCNCSFYGAPQGRSGRLDRAQICSVPEPAQPAGPLARVLVLQASLCCFRVWRAQCV